MSGYWTVCVDEELDGEGLVYLADSIHDAQELAALVAQLAPSPDPDYAQYKRSPEKDPKWKTRKELLEYIVGRTTQQRSDLDKLNNGVRAMIDKEPPEPIYVVQVDEAFDGRGGTYRALSKDDAEHLASLVQRVGVCRDGEGDEGLAYVEQMAVANEYWDTRKGLLHVIADILMTRSRSVQELLAETLNEI